MSKTSSLVDAMFVKGWNTCDFGPSKAEWNRYLLDDSIVKDNKGPVSEFPLQCYVPGALFGASGLDVLKGKTEDRRLTTGTTRAKWDEATKAKAIGELSRGSQRNLDVDLSENFNAPLSADAITSDTTGKRDLSSADHFGQVGLVFSFRHLGAAVISVGCTR